MRSNIRVRSVVAHSALLGIGVLFGLAGCKQAFPQSREAELAAIVAKQTETAKVLASAIRQYTVDNHGAWPPDLKAVAKYVPDKMGLTNITIGYMPPQVPLIPREPRPMPVAGGTLADGQDISILTDFSVHVGLADENAKNLKKTFQGG